MTDIKDELDRFSNFVRERVSDDDADYGLDELFDLWRLENPSSDLYAENVAAAASAIRDYQGGDRGTLAEESSDELRREFGSRRK